MHAHGGGTLDYFALRPDKSYFFTAAGDAMLAYAYLGGHALVGRRPGRAAGRQGARDRRVRRASAAGAAGGRRSSPSARRDLPLYERHGLRSLYLGDEAVIDCDRSLAGQERARGGPPRRRAVRLPARSARPTRRRRCAPSSSEVRERWRADAAERGFTMELGGGVTGENPDLLLAVATDHEDGRPLGFLRLVPCLDEGWSLDLMQHDPDAPNGMTEFLIAGHGPGARAARRASGCR